MAGFTRDLDPRVGVDGRPILYVDESGSRIRQEQGDFYVLGATLVTDPLPLKKLVRAVKARYYPGAKMELKGKSLKPAARAYFLGEMAELTETRVVLHVVYKPKVWKNEFLAEQLKFYKATYANLVKVALTVWGAPIHIVTDQHFADAAAFRHFENCICAVNDYGILSVNPVNSKEHEEIQAADVVAATARYHLVGNSEKGSMFGLLDKILVQHEDSVFPRAAGLPIPLWEKPLLKGAVHPKYPRVKGM